MSNAIEALIAALVKTRRARRDTDSIKDDAMLKMQEGLIIGEMEAYIDARARRAAP